MIEGERDYLHLFSYTNLFVLNNISDFSSKSFFNINNPAVILETIKKVSFRDCLPVKRCSILRTKFNIVKCLERYLHFTLGGNCDIQNRPENLGLREIKEVFKYKTQRLGSKPSNFAILLVSHILQTC